MCHCEGAQLTISTGGHAPRGPREAGFFRRGYTCEYGGSGGQGRFLHPEGAVCPAGKLIPR